MKYESQGEKSDQRNFKLSPRSLPFCDFAREVIITTGVSRPTHVGYGF